MKKTLLLLVLGACASEGTRTDLVSIVDAPHSCSVDAHPDACNGTIIDAPPADAVVTATSPDAHPDASLVDAAPPQAGPALLLWLHGVGGNGKGVYTSEYMHQLIETAPNGNTAWAQTLVGNNLVLITPTGEPNSRNQASWNASRACCQDLANPPDDDTALAAMVSSAIATYHVDPRYVFVGGESNGAIMSWRLICDHADLFAAAAIVVGSANSVSDPACLPSRHVSILAVSGTEDPVIPFYLAKSFGLPALTDYFLPPLSQAGQPGSWEQEARFDGCANPGTLPPMAKAYAFDHDAAGYRGTNNYQAETDVLAYAGCPADGQVVAWRMNGSVHDIVWSPTFTVDAFAWLSAHHR